MGRCTSFNCNNETLEEFESCEDCLFNAFNSNLENFGAPEWVECPNCERQFKPAYYISHLPCEGD